MSNGNFLKEDEKNLIKNAVKYFKKVRYSWYILFNDIPTKTPAPETNDDDDVFTSDGKTNTINIRKIIVLMKILNIFE